MDNANPTVHTVSRKERREATDYDDSVVDTIDSEEIFDIIRDINDPEHPLTLEQLNVVQVNDVFVSDNLVQVEFTPTIPHCSMATLIGLSIKTKLQRSLPERFKIDVCIKSGTHNTAEAINKQLADKERVAAASGNSHLISVVNQCLTKH